MQRAVKSLTPFDFRSDFSVAAAPPAVLEEDPPVRLTTPELVQLLAEARAEGAATVRAEQARDEAERLQAVTNALNEALASLVALTSHLEACALEEGFSERATQLIRATARTIIDGQGDLFAAQQSLKSDPFRG
ncbi:hypothetical protein [Hyphomonas pacifica]|uniref:Uncharacterized protein n=1 Tax=Hyphomonas pacifica TaxID=1280941 RepID=A0A062TVY9_9PROT|nr:hypothetical protein [Hyphomonas pacifica]KCZ49470.1 hypothetical protein HY2_03525 [Hyphomonas pacifica]MBR9806155.1 hypothetical protein [Alphaproteobacteria bacterium]RAN33005.1 hypothetical protein HY11_04750 [Hyphomonas pacifica]RAN33276.1 hypothetical protein HY3_02685 [Hyphomonas pacifica]